MCNQIVRNCISIVFCFIITGICITFPSERSFCCNDNDWKLIFLWVETCLLIICFICTFFCLFLNTRIVNYKQPKVLLNSKTIFEIIILSFFLLCVISNNSVLSGIAISDKHVFPISHLVPKLAIRILRPLIGSLLTLWIFVYDMKYSPLEGKYAKFLKLRYLMHAFLSGMILVQTARFAVLVLLWPDAMRDILEKTNEDTLYFAITIPASNMFWLKCFFKLWQSQPDGTSDNDHVQFLPHSNEMTVEAFIPVLKRTNYKWGMVLITALALVGVMYAIDLLDTSENVYTACAYGLFRMITPANFIILILIIIFCEKRKDRIQMADIHFDRLEIFQLCLFALMKIGVNILNCIWFSSPDHPNGDCKIPEISITAEVVDSIFNLLQFICLLNQHTRNRLSRSSTSYLLLLAMNFGLIWFDLSLEVLHLKHYTHDYKHLSSEYVFLIIQAVFWMGLEFHITIVEILIVGWLTFSERKRQSTNVEELIFST